MNTHLKVPSCKLTKIPNSNFKYYAEFYLPNFLSTPDHFTAFVMTVNDICPSHISVTAIKRLVTKEIYRRVYLIEVYGSRLKGTISIMVEKPTNNSRHSDRSN